MLKLLRERSVMKMASHDQEQQMKVGWKKKYLYGKNVRRKLMLHNFFIFIGNRGYCDSYILSQREKKPSIIFFFHKTKEKRVEVGPCQS